MSRHIKAWRYMYRSLAHSTPMGPWHLLNKTCPPAYEDSARELVERWNKKDAGNYEWRFEECLPDDIDYPEWLEKEQPK